MRKTLVTGTFYLLEPQICLALPTVLCLLGLVPPGLLGVLLLARIFIDGFSWYVQARELPRLGDLLIVPLKEAMLFAAWVQAIFTFHVKWRADKAIRLGHNSLVISKSANPSKLGRSAEALRRVFGRVA
jgi:hypothetical protein